VALRAAGRLARGPGQEDADLLGQDSKRAGRSDAFTLAVRVQRCRPLADHLSTQTLRPRAFAAQADGASRRYRDDPAVAGDRVSTPYIFWSVCQREDAALAGHGSMDTGERSDGTRHGAVKSCPKG
jgi:hypothetical protein